MHVAQAVRFDDVQLLVLALAQVRVDDDRAVVTGVDQRRVVAVLLHRPDHPFQLSGGDRVAFVDPLGDPPGRLGGGGVRVEPLAHFPIERDLVTVIDDFMAKLARVKPYLIPKEPAPRDAEYRQTPAELKKFKQFTLCINCMLCYAACPEYGLIPGYLGPAAITLAHRWNRDSRDGGREARQEEIAAKEGAWECSFVGACSEVCPEHVDPAAAIQQVKIENTVDWYKDHLMPWLKK